VNTAVKLQKEPKTPFKKNYKIRQHQLCMRNQSKLKSLFNHRMSNLLWLIIIYSPFKPAWLSFVVHKSWHFEECWKPHCF